jgi:ribosomal protein L32
MTAQRPSPLGECPSCGAQIADHHVLIQYQTHRGTGVYAECPCCEAVISPE